MDVKGAFSHFEIALLKHGPTPVDVWIGARMKARREQLGLSQAKLGEALSVSFQQIQKYESGRNRVAASKISLLAKALDVPNTFFFMIGDDLNDIEEASEMHNSFLKDRQAREWMMLFGAVKSDRSREKIILIMRTIVDALESAREL